MKPDFIDIHAHVNFEAYKEDRDDVVRRALDSKVWMINVGTQINTSKSSIELSKKYDRGVYSCIGLHPVHTSESHHDEKELGKEGENASFLGENGFDYEAYLEMANNPKVLAIGECGLDYFRIENQELRLKQEDVFRKQIELAVQVGKPLMLHIRNAYSEAYEILKKYSVKYGSKLKANLHFFAGNVDDARKFLDLGFSFSFTGVVTFARNYDEVIRNIPLDRIMSETDCPYVTPVPHRGKRNEPVYVIEVVKKIADIRGEDFEKVKIQLLENAFAFFNL